jgi:hypothetical protein
MRATPSGRWTSTGQLAQVPDNRPDGQYSTGWTAIRGVVVGESITRWRSAMTSSDSETGSVTGTKDKDYNIIWFTEACLSNALRLETYIQDAERDGDTELADFFRRAQGESRKGAEQGKRLLASRLGG